MLELLRKSGYKLMLPSKKVCGSDQFFTASSNNAQVAGVCYEVAEAMSEAVTTQRIRTPHLGRINRSFFLPTLILCFIFVFACLVALTLSMEIDSFCSMAY
jgi:hypothetical protein